MTQHAPRWGNWRRGGRVRQGSVATLWSYNQFASTANSALVLPLRQRVWSRSGVSGSPTTTYSHFLCTSIPAVTRYAELITSSGGGAAKNAPGELGTLSRFLAPCRGLARTHRFRRCVPDQTDGRPKLLHCHHDLVAAHQRYFHPYRCAHRAHPNRRNVPPVHEKYTPTVEPHTGHCVMPGPIISCWMPL